MSDQALRNAEMQKEQLLDRKRALVKEIEQIDNLIDRANTFINEWHVFARGNSQDLVHNFLHERKLLTVPPLSTPPESLIGAVRKTTGNSKKEDVAEAAYEIIFERGQPIMRDELYQLLIDRGFRIQGKDPQMVLSTMLWRMKDRVVRLKSGGYWLADEPLEEAGYHPDLEEIMGAADPDEPPTPDDYDDD